MPSTLRRSILSGLGPAVMMAFAMGCRPADSITQYTVEKEPVPPLPSLKLPEPTGEKMRTIAAMVPNDEKTWYFKMTGPEKLVEGEMENFLHLVNSVKFDKGNGTLPSWTLPEGWSEEPGTGMRFRTLRSAGETPQELSVIPLDGDASDDDYLLQNINRWRGQLGLGPKTPKTLFSSNTRSDEARRETLAGRSVVLVNFVGHSQPSDMGGGPPFAGRGPFEGGGASTLPTANPPKATNSSLKYKAPKGWEPGEVGGMRKAAFQVRDGKSSADFTAIDLVAQGAAGDWVSNVNRWRGQLGLEEVGDMELQEMTRTLKVDGVEGQVVELTGKSNGKPQTMLGAMVLRKGKAWFFKFQGDPDLVKRETANFDAFLKSVKFGD